MNPHDERDARLAEALFQDDHETQPVLDQNEADELESLQQTLAFLDDHREAPPETPSLEAFWDDFEGKDKRRTLQPLWFVAAAVLLASFVGMFWPQSETKPPAIEVSTQDSASVPEVKTPQFTSAEQFGRKSQMLLLAIANRNVTFAAAGGDRSTPQWHVEQKHAEKLAQEADVLLESPELTDREISLVRAIGALMLQIANLQPGNLDQLKLIQDALERQDLLFKIDFFILKRTMQA